MTEAERRLVEAQRLLAAYRDSDRVLKTLDDDTNTRGLIVRSDRVRDAQRYLAEARTRFFMHDLPRVDELRRDWPTMEVAAQRRVMSQVIDCVFVGRGHVPPAGG